MSPFKIIFIHGYTASSTSDWYPNISKELDKLGIDYSIPDLPGKEHPQADKWIERIHKEVLKTNKPLVLVGHSLGTRVALLYLEKYPTKVKRVFLIAAFSNDPKNGQRNDGEIYPDFFTHVIDLNKIKPLVGKFIVVHSTDDTSIAYEQGVEIANELAAKLIIPENRDHLSDPADASYLLEILTRELQI